MVIAEHFRTALARGTMCIDQGLRIDLEKGCRGWMDISCGKSLSDLQLFAQQYSAAFIGVSLPSLLLDLLDHISCHCESHRAWP